MFIKLHVYNSNLETLVNTDKILIIDTDIDNEKDRYYGQVIVPSSHSEDLWTCLNVNETPDRIYNMINANEPNVFIKLHNADNNTSIIVRKEIIEYVQACDDTRMNKTKITCEPCNGVKIPQFFVNESTSKINEMLTDSNVAKK